MCGFKKLNVKCEKLNIFTHIFHYIYRQIHTNWCNKINFTDIPLYFPLQQQIYEDIIKADIEFDIFIMCQQFILRWFFVLPSDDFLVSQTQTWSKSQGQTPIKHTVYTYSQMNYL